ncbi:hypothetical protein FIBSPDRAFT_958327 [Athelia psychrophila]|uniref:Uncharacterized protein n=1 Tax=Athelia psychrophila TaxID=1759441 RepID=A0A166EPR4_9AGAM|nr:hypothetical protein FIBSPDRAFT_958327 [Fibularhizoctonia sp. CBS 109695]
MPREHDRREQQSQHRAPRPHVHNHCPFPYSHPYCPSPLFPEMESETGLERGAIVDESVPPGAVAEGGAAIGAEEDADEAGEEGGRRASPRAEGGERQGQPCRLCCSHSHSRSGWGGEKGKDGEGGWARRGTGRLCAVSVTALAAVYASLPDLQKGAPPSNPPRTSRPPQGPPARGASTRTHTAASNPAMPIFTPIMPILPIPMLPSDAPPTKKASSPAMHPAIVVQSAAQRERYRPCLCPFAAVALVACVRVAARARRCCPIPARRCGRTQERAEAWGLGEDGADSLTR